MQNLRAPHLFRHDGFLAQMVDASRRTSHDAAAPTPHVDAHTILNRASPAEVARARRLLALEGAQGGAGAGDSAVAAGLVFDKLFARLAPLVGSAGVRALLVRSAKLTRREFGVLEVSDVESSGALCARLGEQEPAVAKR